MIDELRTSAHITSVLAHATRASECPTEAISRFGSGAPSAIRTHDLPLRRGLTDFTAFNINNLMHSAPRKRDLT